MNKQNVNDINKYHIVNTFDFEREGGIIRSHFSLFVRGGDLTYRMWTITCILILYTKECKSIIYLLSYMTLHDVCKTPNIQGSNPKSCLTRRGTARYGIYYDLTHSTSDGRRGSALRVRLGRVGEPVESVEVRIPPPAVTDASTQTSDYLVSCSCETSFNCYAIF